MKTGYDLGGAEYPYNPENLTVVDILTPDPEHGADYYRRDLCKLDWHSGLKPRAFIYIGRTLRYVNNPHLAQQVLLIWDGSGTITIFDDLGSIAPFLQRLIELDENLRVEIDLINSNPSDPDDVPDWGVTITRL